MYQRILVPVDGSDTSNRGLDEAVALAKQMGSKLLVLHVVDEPFFAHGAEGVTGASELLSLVREAAQGTLKTAQQRAAASGVPVQAVLRDSFDGRVCDLVVKEARNWKADLIVIGTHGRRGPGRVLLGSDAEQILRLAPVPVLLVREAVH